MTVLDRVMRDILGVYFYQDTVYSYLFVLDILGYLHCRCQHMSRSGIWWWHILLSGDDSISKFF